MTVCGPQLSLCCMCLSVWGVIQLAIMGGLYYVQSVGLFEDLKFTPIIQAAENITFLYEETEKRYTQTALNCWIAAAVYVVTLVLSVHQFRANMKNKKE